MMTIRGRALAAIALPLLSAACGSYRRSKVEDVPEHLRHARIVVPTAGDRHPYGDVSKTAPGQWATYREGDRTVTLAAVGKEGDSVWIEKIDEGDPRQVSARLVGPDGVVDQAWYGEIGKDGWRSPVERQTLEQAAAEPARPAEAGRDRGEETVTVAGRALKAVRIRVRYEDLDGRLTEEISLWHPDVPPLYAGSEHGGLIRRETARRRVELVNFGGDAQPLLKPPAPPAASPPKK